MTSYAQKANAFYNQTASHFISLRERFTESLSELYEFQLDGVIAEFKRKHKDWVKFADLSTCRAITTTMDKILIDTTMQRQVNFPHILRILQNFKETMVMAIQVYEDPEKPGYFIAWDGQHTALVLYILATKVFGERIAQLPVSVVVYPVKMKAEIRRNFILLNGDAKEPLEFIDIFRQMVCGVRIDKADDPVWEQAELKQQYLEKVGLFATNSKFGDEDQPGAFTLLAGTIMSDSEKTLKHPEVTRMFAEYWAILNQQRPVDAKEARQLYEYFDACYEQGITVDRAYLVEFAQFTKDYFEADFSASGPFWAKVKDAYTKWYIDVTPDVEYNKDGDPIVRGFSSEWRCGGPFIIAQLKNSTKLATPKYSANNGFSVKKAWLW
jgi:tRNA (Thr-GGU) A37 N-methylase